MRSMGSKMYNLNVNVNASAGGLLGVAAAEVTPRTPEIINSLIAMNNPFEGYCNERSRDRTDSTSSGGEPSPPSVQHTCSQLIKEGNFTIQHSLRYIIFLIFHWIFWFLGLKLTLQTKRRANGSEDEGNKKTKKEDDSADDEEEEEDDSSSNHNSASNRGVRINEMR